MNKYIYKKEPIWPVMAERLKYVKIPQPLDNVCHYNQDDKFVTMMKRVAAQVIDTTDDVICQEIIDFAKKEGVTDLYLIDKKFIIEAIHDKGKNDSCIDELRKEIDDLKKRNAYLEGVRLGAKHLQDKLYDDIHAIAEERDAVIEKNGTLAKRIGELEDIVSGQKKELQETIDSCEAYRVELRNVKKKLTEKYEENKRLGLTINDLNTLLSNKNERIRQQYDEIVELKKENKRLRDANTCACEELDNKCKQNEELFKENKAFESMLSKAEQQRDFYMRRTSDYDRLKERIAKQDKQIDKYDLVIHTIEQLFGCAFDI